MAKSSSKEKDTDWALTLKQDPIHIDLAQSGRNNYFCLGCRKEVIAVKQTKNPHWQSYFRHYAKDVNRNLAECVVASRMYRERLAEQILLRLKKLKVPAVLKYPPRGIEGAPMLLQQPQKTIAHRVQSQLSFYEDENGEIKRGKNPDLKDRFLLIRPDVTFFDTQDNPILFIEFVITHKLDIEKKIKLARLGIDTVQIIIPKKPEPEIEKTLTSSRAIKWVYNAKEANTEYIPPASGNSGGIYELDEDQRKLFEESFRCRSNQIGNLIRSIKRCYRSESYRRTERNFEQAISRIEKARERAESRLADLEEGIGREISSGIENQFRVEVETLEREEKKHQDYRQRLEERYRELESEYYREKNRLAEEEAALEKEQRDISESIRRGEQPGEAERNLREEFAAAEEELNREIKEVEFEIENLQQKERRFDRDLESEEREVVQSEIRAISQFGKSKEKLEDQTRDIESQIANFGDYTKGEIRGIEGEFEEIGKQSIKRINKRDVSGNNELSSRIKTVLEARRICSNFGQEQSHLESAKEALQFVRSGTWKNK